MLNLNFSRRDMLQSLLLLGAGLANTLAFAPYQYTMAPLFSLMLLCLVLNQAQSAGKAVWYSFVYGLGWFGLGVSWVHVSIATFGGMPLIASLSIMALLVAYLSLFPAFAGWLSYRLSDLANSKSNRISSDRNQYWWPLLYASCWVLAENLRSWLFTGFPWLSLGYSQTEGLLAPYAPLIGESGITFIIVFAAASLIRVSRKQWQMATVAILLLLMPALLSPFKGWQLTDKTVSVALVQGNIKQELRWDPAQELPTMKKYMQLTKPHLQQQIIVWPEAAIPQVEPLAQAYLYNLDIQAAENNSAVITGILDYKRNNDAYNGMIVLGQSSITPTSGDYRYENNNRYQKHHLLPIGEFVPFEKLLRDIAPFFDLPNSSFARGDWRQPNLQANGYHLLAALCFEIAFPRQIQANFTDETDLLLTVSNDAWFGASIGPLQHMQIAQMRALEFGRPLLRSTNNGVTAVVHADGTIQTVLPQFVEGVLTADVQLVKGRTLYSYIGDLPLMLLSFGVLAFHGYCTWRRRRQVHPTA